MTWPSFPNRWFINIRQRIRCARGRHSYETVYDSWSLREIDGKLISHGNKTETKCWGCGKEKP